VDVLSDVVGAARTGRPHSARMISHAPFGRWFPPAPGAGFHVLMQGPCWLLPVEGDPIRLGPGDVVFLPRGSAHGVADSATTPMTGDAAPDAERAGPDSAATVMLCGAYLLDRPTAHPLLNDLPEIMHLPARVGRHPSLRAAVDLLGAELERDAEPGTDAVVPALLDLLLLYVLRAWFDDRRAGHDQAIGWGAALHDPAVAAALRALHGDPRRAWTVGELARRAGLSRAAFARRFTRLVGRPPLAYLTWWRMTIAARLLRTLDVPVDSVARRVGYSSQYAFAHAFKRQYGSPPGAYRRTSGMDRRPS
jgi:AraC-like DNA-binding protein